MRLARKPTTFRGMLMGTVLNGSGTGRIITPARPLTTQEKAA